MVVRTKRGASLSEKKGKTGRGSSPQKANLPSEGGPRWREERQRRTGEDRAVLQCKKRMAEKPAEKVKQE